MNNIKIVSRDLVFSNNKFTRVTLTDALAQQITNQVTIWLNEWFAALSASLADVRIACGGWERICSPGTMTRNGTCAVVLDPPYSQTMAVYAHDSSTVAHDVREWAIANGDNQKLRIALCGHDGEHNALEAAGWSVDTWAKGGGYQGKDDRERIWFSPHCLNPNAAIRSQELILC